MCIYMRTTFIILSLLWAFCVSSQTIRGRIIDEQSMSMAFVNVMLLNRADSAFVQSVVTKEDGTFSISTNKSDGLLKVTCVGFKTTFIDARQGDMGDILMQTDTHAFGEIVVKGERPKYKMTTGGISIDIQHSMLKDIGTADAVLSMLPLVHGEDGSFTVFSKGKPEIYINNKKVQNTQELKQLKSTDINSIDVITSPGNKYNAEVGAVIRIKCVKPMGNGTSVEAYGSVKYNNNWTTYDDATVKYRTGGLELSGNITFNNGNHSEDNMLTINTFANDNHVNIVQYAPNSFWYTLLGGQLKASYDIDEDNSVGCSYTLNGSLYQGGIAQTQQVIKRNGELEGEINQLMNIGMNSNPQHEANVYYVGKAGKLDIDFNLSWIWKKSSRDQLSSEESLQLSNRDVTTHSENRNDMLAGKIVLTYPVWKGEVSAGMEATVSHSHGIYDNVERIVSSSDDESREKNVAGFAEYSLKLGRLKFGCGLRHEAVKSDYYSFGERQPEPSRTYNDLFPTFNVGWQKGKWGIQLGYDKRISRPYYQLLNSNVQYDNRYQYEGGNPLLRPTIKHNVELNATYSWLNFTVDYSYNKDMQLDFCRLYQEGTEITVWTNQNFDRFVSYNASLAASPKFGFYSPTLTLSYMQQNFDTKVHGIVARMKKPQFEADFRNWFAIGKTTKAMFYIHYSTSYDYGFTHYDGEFNVNVRIQQKLFNEKVTVALFANDIFRNLRDRWTGNYPVSTMAKDAYTYTRNVGLSLSYNFNATQSKYKGTGAGNAEKARL